MTTIFAKMALIYLTIGLFLTISGGSLGLGISNPITESFLKNDTSGGSSPVFSDRFNDTFPNVQEDSSSSIIGAFIDTVKSVSTFIIFLGTVFFALPMVLLQFELPNIILMMVGIPLAVGGVIGLIMFVRAGN